MTFGEVESRARAKARASVSGASQPDVFDIINTAVVTFGRDVNGLQYKEYPSLAESFDLETHFGIHLTISGSSDNDCDTDVSVTSADAANQTGAQVATMLQSQIRSAIGAGATATVAWTDYYFTVDSIDGTSIEITEPDDDTNYADYTEELFGGTISASTNDVDGGFPESCTLRASLDAEMLRVEHVLWDDSKLSPVPRGMVIDSRSSGRPAYYNVWNRKIQLYPAPENEGKLYIEYLGVPEEVSNPGQDDDIPDIPEQYQQALIWYTSYELLMDSFEEKRALQRYGMYRRIVGQYKADHSNNNPSLVTGSGNALWYTVNTTSG